MELDDLIAYKNIVFSEYERAKADKSRKYYSLTFQVATLEESIAEELMKIGKFNQAAVNYVSQGSFLFELGRLTEGKAAWDKAKEATKSETLKAWIDEGLKQYFPQETPSLPAPEDKPEITHGET